MRTRLLSLLATGLLAGSFVPALADGSDSVSPSLRDVADECASSLGDGFGDPASEQLNPRTCRSIEQLAIGADHTCRWGDAVGDTVLADDVVDRQRCAHLGGQVVSEQLVAEYEASAVHVAHAAQRSATATTPLHELFLLSTHNSYNHASRRPALSGLDSNHRYSMVDQLRMDIRGLELDVHTFPSAEGAGMTPIMCHGGVGPWGHEGCTVEEPFADALRELRAWLDANPTEVVVLEIEDHLDGPDGHAAGVAAIEAVLGSGSDDDLIHRPSTVFPGRSTGECVGLPLGLALGQVVAAGDQVLLFSSCEDGGTGWNDLVFSNDGGALGGERARNGQLSPAERSALAAAATSGGACPTASGWNTTDPAHWVRYHQDATWVSAMAGASVPAVTAAELAGSATCGWNMPSLDLVHPRDERLAAALWMCAETSFRADHGAACDARDAAISG